MFIAGDTSKSVIALETGWVKIVAETEEGGQALLALCSRGDLVGEQAALEDEPRSASVICASAVWAYVIPQKTFLQYLADHHDAHLAITRALSAKLRLATRHRVDFSGPTVDVRLARVLSELVGKNGRPTAEGTELGYALTQPELAAIVGVSVPSVQRALRRLRDIGVLDTGYRKIVIPDIPALKKAAGPGGNSGQESIS